MRQVHKTGEKLFVDYAGPTVRVEDPEDEYWDTLHENIRGAAYYEKEASC